MVGQSVSGQGAWCCASHSPSQHDPREPWVFVVFLSCSNVGLTESREQATLKLEIYSMSSKQHQFYSLNSLLVFLKHLFWAFSLSQVQLYQSTVIIQKLLSLVIFLFVCMACFLCFHCKSRKEVCITYVPTHICTYIEREKERNKNDLLQKTQKAPKKHKKKLISHKIKYLTTINIQSVTFQSFNTHIYIFNYQNHNLYETLIFFIWQYIMNIFSCQYSSTN